MYESITKYQKLLKDKRIGTWVSAVTDDNKEHRSIRMPYVRYPETVDNFIRDVYKFMDEHPELELNQYQKILDENGIQWSRTSMMYADVDRLDATSIMALIVGVIRSERYSDGTIQYFLKLGKITGWLQRLKELDEVERIQD